MLAYLIYLDVYGLWLCAVAEEGGRAATAAPFRVASATIPAGMAWVIIASGHTSHTVLEYS